MDERDYERLFNEVSAELEILKDRKAGLQAELVDLDAKMDAMTKSYNAIAPLVGKTPIPDPEERRWRDGIDIDTLKAGGITTAVRYVIDATANTNGKGMTATNVRDKLASLGWDWERYAKPLATVHKVLTRLAASGAIKEVADGGTKSFVSCTEITDDDVPF